MQSARVAFLDLPARCPLLKLPTRTRHLLPMPRVMCTRLGSLSFAGLRAASKDETQHHDGPLSCVVERLCTLNLYPVSRCGWLSPPPVFGGGSGCSAPEISPATPPQRNPIAPPKFLFSSGPRVVVSHRFPRSSALYISHDAEAVRGAFRSNSRRDVPLSIGFYSCMHPPQADSQISQSVDGGGGGNEGADHQSITQPRFFSVGADPRTKRPRHRKAISPTATSPLTAAQTLIPHKGVHSPSRCALHNTSWAWVRGCCNDQKPSTVHRFFSSLPSQMSQDAKACQDRSSTGALKGPEL